MRPPRRPRRPVEPTLEELDREGIERFRGGAFDRAAAAYRRLLDRLRRAGTSADPDTQRLEGEMELRLAAALRRAGQLKEARTRVERAIAQAVESPAVQAAAHVLLAELHLLGGNRPLAELSSDKALDLTVGRDEPASAWALGQRGRVLWADQFHEEARQSFLQAHAVAVRHGDAANAALIAGNVGMCLLELGQLPEARTWVARAVDEAARAGAPAVEARWLVGLARVALAQGVLDEADALAERALAVSRPLGHHLTTFRAEWLRHYLVALSDPGQRDRGRLAALRTLRARLADFVDDREMRRLDEALRSTAALPAKGIASFTDGCDPIPPPEPRPALARAG